MRLAIALLQPTGACRKFTRSGSSYPPLGLCQLAATVNAEDARVFDADGEGWDETTTIKELLKANPKAMGLTATSFTLDLVEDTSRKIKNAITGVKDGFNSEFRVIVGGPHASMDPRDVLKRCPSVDAVVRGEGEVVFPQIVERIRRDQSLRNIPGVLERGDDGPIPDIVRVEDFSALPFPKIDGLPVENYWCPDAMRRPMMTFMTSRGCPFKCGFCSSPKLMGKKIRGWEVPSILDELERLKIQFGVQEISFVDDVFTAQPKRTLELCQGMYERKLDLSWFCNVRADQVNDKLAHAMRLAGCHQAYIGVESGSPEILKRVQKGATVQALERGAEILRCNGIARSVGFVVGLPGETDHTVQLSITLAHRIRPERIQFTRWMPLPGSPLVEAGFGPPPSPDGANGSFSCRDGTDQDRVSNMQDTWPLGQRGGDSMKGRNLKSSVMEGSGSLEVRGLHTLSDDSERSDADSEDHEGRSGQRMLGTGFHDKAAEDKVSRWIKLCYEACSPGGGGWGKASW